jgi:signal transduction histidine kinase
LSTLLTAIAGFLAVRALQHHHRIVDERNRLVARRAEELEQFAGRVAHDILGPLSATRLAVSHAAGQLQDPALKRTLERGQRGVDRVASIVDGLLRFARAGARPEPGVVSSVAPVVQSVVAELEPLARDAGITLTAAEVPPCAIYGHAGVLASVVENLTRNALKYMGERSERRVEVRVQPRADVVRVEVEDTGPGIPPALYDTIFDPHVRGRNDGGKPGIGLGLATVKRIAEAHGGAVGFRSKLDAGTTFWVELPRADYDDDNREKRANAQAGK